MKTFTLRSASEERKADQALGLKAMYSLFLFLFVAGVTYKLFELVFGKNTNPEFNGRLFMPGLIFYSTLVPAIVKMEWKQLAPKIIISTFILTIFLMGFMRLV